MAKLVDEIRDAILKSGKTRYRIAKESGVSAGQLSRLVNGERGMAVDTIERLADYLGLRITIEPKTPAKAKTTNPRPTKPESAATKPTQARTTKGR